MTLGGASHAGNLGTLVEGLVSRDGRQVGTAGHERAKRFLLHQLRVLGLVPYSSDGSYEIGYRVRGQAFTNLVGVAQGQDRSLAPILIGAHYDTAGPLPGADDNAAAVAIALEVARELVSEPISRDVVIALFDAEEPPFYLGEGMGSIRFYEDQLQTPLHAALVMDLVGHDVRLPGLSKLVFITGMESSPMLEHVVRSVEVPVGLRFITALNEYVGDVSDHHAFRVGGTPYLFFSCGRWEHYHQPTDTVDKLNFEKMSHLTTLLLRAVRLLDSERTIEAVPYDTTATDLAFMRPVLGPFVEQMGLSLDSREDIDLVASQLQSMFGI